MYSPDVALGLGSLVYALSCLEGRPHKEEIIVAKALLVREPHGSLALNGYFLRENAGESAEEAYAFGMRRLVSRQTELTDKLKKRFVTLLLRVARAHKGISANEWLFIRRFRRDLQQLQTG
ncbi:MULTISPECIES: TerB family tellurite resistance protein [Spirosoma]|uniref:TerB family tellurite resistance protein n=1 Tax=Spirosoma liriopis TaxID=2937440 RepID=A0ABT0HSY2_9BACT|nr:MULTISPECIES: TerB family tellurite resistance protein [Spirosoma]MCK8495085.1 TerB family tellurite resistance protein [Spirosoma liriopis]UHG94326.1 TerB family tellurite resistance protein [Spirosoma oryzicola]